MIGSRSTVVRLDTVQQAEERFPPGPARDTIVDFLRAGGGAVYVARMLTNGPAFRIDLPKRMPRPQRWNALTVVVVIPDRARRVITVQRRKRRGWRT